MSILVNNWRMDSSLNALIHASTGEVRRLGEYHFILLETLVNHADTVLSRSFLMSEVWKNRVVGGNSLPTAIHALRTAIDDNGKQQEIIKTIPKKGYLFNKSYISVVDHDEENNTSPSINNDNQPSDDLAKNKIQQTTPVIDNVALSIVSSTEKTITPGKENLHKMLFIALTLMLIVLFLSARFYDTFAKENASDTPVIIKEAALHADHIAIYHLYDESAEKEILEGTSHIAGGLENIEQLLTQHKSSIDLYYKVTFNKLAMNMIIQNQCNHSWQLALRFNNWQSKDAEIKNIMYQEVEKMLNEMPACK
ncbi:transcriptional regulator [Kluyvera ascorbata]|uniref:transcriptional regulator n=1 Tax=Kluyvera ascorbata TaxID=51288 RepID=UPI00374D5C50